MDTIVKFLQDCKVFYVATAENDQPRVRPFGAVCVYDGRLYIGTHNQKPVSKQMKTNPKIEISAMSPDGDTWLRLTSEAVAHDCREARQAMLDAVPSIQSMYNADDGLFEVFYLQNASGSICTFGSQPDVHTF